jgi:hypothetical protein
MRAQVATLAGWPMPSQFGRWQAPNFFFFFSSIIRIADKRDHSYAMFLTYVDVHNSNEKNILKKNNFASNEAINFFGSRRFSWVGRKGETNKILFYAQG